MSNAVFGKTMENVRKHRDIKLVTDKNKRCKLISKSNYHTTKWFSEEFVAMETKKTKARMSKPISLGFSILEVSKTLMYEFWYDYMKTKYVEKAKLCYTDTESFIVYIKTEDFYEDVATDFDKWFDTSGYIIHRSLPMGKNKKVLCKFKDELGGRIMTEFVGVGPKIYSFLIDDFEKRNSCENNTTLHNRSVKQNPEEFYLKRVKP